MGNFAPLKKSIASERGPITSRLAAIGKAGALAGAGLAAVSAKMSIDFQHSMTLVQTQAGASAKEVDNLTQSILKFSGSGKTEFGPKDLADALYSVESAGIHGSKAMETLKRSSDLATIGQADLADTTKALVAAQKTGIKGSSNLKDAIGTLNATVGAGQMHLEDLVGAMGTGFLSSAANMGLKLEDVGAALAEMTKQGVPASSAATRLRMTFSLLAAPTDKAKSSLKGIGLGAERLAKIMRTQGLVPALERLQTAMGDMSKVEQTQFLAGAFGGAKSGSTIMALLNNLGDLDSTLGNIKQHSDEVNKSLAAARADPAVQLQEAWAQLQTIMVQLGSKIVPTAVAAIHDFSDIVTDPKLSSDEKVSQVVDLITKSITDAAPAIGKAGLMAGEEAAKGLVDGFMSSDALGKLVIGAGLIRVLGGPGALMGLGKNMGRYIGGGAAASTATSMQQGLVAQGVSTSSVSSKLGGYFKGVGNRMGVAMIGGLAAQVGGSAVGGETGSRIATVGSAAAAGFAVAGPWGAAGGAAAGMVLASFQEKSIGDQMAQAVSQQFADEIPVAIKKATAKMNMKPISQAADAMRQTIATIQSINSDADVQPLVDQLNKLTAAGDDLNEKIMSVRQGFRFLGSGAGASIKDITRVMSQNKHVIENTMGTDSAKARDKLSENFMLAAGAIKQAMKRGDISTKQGMAEMHRLILNSKIENASQHTAQNMAMAWSKGMSHTDDVTKKGVDRIIGHLGDMTPSARKIAVNTMLAQLSVAKKEGTLSDKAFDKIRSGILSKFTDIQVGATQKSGAMLLGVAKNIAGLAGTVTGGMGIIGANANSALKAFGVKALKFTLQNPKELGKDLGQASSFIGSFLKAEGGLAAVVPGVGPGDKHTLSLNGVPIAKTESGEGVFVGNRTMMGGLSAINSGIPRQPLAKGGMAAMIAEASRFESHHFPYSWGGGHGGFGIQPVDCSGAVSDVLHAGGLLNVPMVSGALMNWGRAGTGPLTVYASPEHTVMSLDGRFFGTSGSNPGGGAGWIEGGSPGLVSGGVARTMGVSGAALPGGIPHVVIAGPNGAMKSYGQAGLDKVRAGAEKYVQAHMPAGTFGGGDAGLGTFPALPGGWHRVGATYEGLDGAQGAYGTVGGMGFAELLLAGANAGMHPNLSDVLGYGGVMAPHTQVQFRMPGAKQAAMAEKNDIGSGQAGNGHYLADIQTGLMHAIGWHPNADVEVKHARLGGVVQVPRAHSGEIIGGPPGSESLRVLQSGEEVRSAQATADAKVPMHLTLHLYPGREKDPVEAVLDDDRFWVEIDTEIHNEVDYRKGGR